MVFRGRDDLRVLLGAVYGALSGLTWREVIGEGATRVAVSDARIAGVTITDAMVLELDDAGLIVRIRPHLRPWLAITLFALSSGPRLPVIPACFAARCEADCTEPPLQSGVQPVLVVGLECVCRPSDVAVGSDQQRANLEVVDGTRDDIDAVGPYMCGFAPRVRRKGRATRGVPGEAGRLPVARRQASGLAPTGPRADGRRPRRSGHRSRRAGVPCVRRRSAISVAR